MAENTMRVGYAPITGTIYAGRLNAAGDTWVGERQDVTSDVLGSVIQKIGDGNVMTISEDGEPTWQITVRRFGAGPTPNEARLSAALARMIDMHDAMFKQTNVGASFYSGDTIAEMNEAPQQARQALAAHWKSLTGEKS